MSYPEDIHWRRVVSNLRNSGLSHQEIAMETGFSVKDLALMESEVYYPPYLSIMKLIDLHYERCEGRHGMIGYGD